MRWGWEKLMDEVAPLKNVGLQVKALILKINQVEEKVDSSTAQTDVIEWKGLRNL